MARSIDSIAKDQEGFVRVGDECGTVLFRVINTASGLMVHIRLKGNCKQVKKRGDPDFYIPWSDFVETVEDERMD